MDNDVDNKKDLSNIEISKQDASLYEQLRLLGKGGCAQVFLVKNKETGKYVTNFQLFCIMILVFSHFTFHLWYVTVRWKKAAVIAISFLPLCLHVIITFFYFLLQYHSCLPQTVKYYFMVFLVIGSYNLMNFINASNSVIIVLLKELLDQFFLYKPIFYCFVFDLSLFYIQIFCHEKDWVRFLQEDENSWKCPERSQVIFHYVYS